MASFIDDGKTALKAWFTDTLKLPQYFDAFYDEGYEDLEDFDESIKEKDIIDIGVNKKGHIRKILKAISALHPNDQNIKKNQNQPDDNENQIERDNGNGNGNGNDNDINNNDEEEKKYASAPVYHGPKKKVSLVFVGETGVGKTTLLKSLGDFIDHVPFENVKCTTKPEAVGLSQTQHTAQYQLSNEQWAVNIIDTPGIGDTSRAEKDAQHMDGIIDYLGEYGDFNAICILIKRGTTRLTTRMRYIVNELRANMPKDVENNFIVIITRSDVPVTQKDTMAVIEGLHLPTGNVIPVNNGAYEELDLQDYPDGSPIVKIAKQRQRTDYASNHEYLQILLETAEKMTPYQGDKIKALKLKRNILNEDVGVLRKTIDSTFEIEKEIKEELAAFAAAQSDEQLNKAYEIGYYRYDYEYIKNGKISTTCISCNKVCDSDCGLSYQDDLNRCSCAGSGGYCRVCGHSMSNHSHLGWVRQQKQVWVTNVNDTMKLKFCDAQQRKKKIEERQKELNDQLITLQKKRDQCANSIQQKYQELEKIAIIGYNESFEQYMIECKKAVEKDEKLTKEEKAAKVGIFNTALETFMLLKDAIKGQLKKAADYVF